MTAAQEHDSVRPGAGTGSVFDGRTVPAGMRGAVLDAMPGGGILAGFAVAPQTAESDGDFVQGVLSGRPGPAPVRRRSIVRRSR